MRGLRVWYGCEEVFLVGGGGIGGVVFGGGGGVAGTDADPCPEWPQRALERNPSHPLEGAAFAKQGIPLADDETSPFAVANRQPRRPLEGPHALSPGDTGLP